MKTRQKSLQIMQQETVQGPAQNSEEERELQTVGNG